MNDTCSHCGVPFAREGGFYLGAIYFNYGLTALIVAIAYPLLVFTQAMPAHTALRLGLGFTVFFPLLIFRHARSLWLGFDEFVDPHAKEVPTPPSEPSQRS
jgi:hypothetical protein